MTRVDRLRGVLAGFPISIYTEFRLLLRAPCLTLLFNIDLLLGTKYILLYTRPA